MAALVLRQSTQVIVRVGPFMDSLDAVTPETGITLAAADQAEALKAAGAATVDISGNTFAAITGAGGWYDLTLTTTDTNTVGDLTIVIQDTSVCLPVSKTFQVIEEALYDGIYAAAAAVIPANMTQISGDAAAADAFETMLDGGGGNALTLSQLRINSTVAGGAIDIDNTAGPAISARTSSGDAVDVASTGGNGDGISSAGNGSGHGMNIVGGATGHGVLSTGGATSGDGIHSEAATLGDGIDAVGKGSGGIGLRAIGGTNASGILANGAGTGAGMELNAGATGHGLNSTGGATSGIGIRAEGPNNGAGIHAIGNLEAGIHANADTTGEPGIRALGLGGGPGISAEGGASGHGIHAISGSTSGDGIRAEADPTANGHGFHALGGLIGDGIHAVAQVAGEGIDAVGSGGGVGIRAQGQGGGAGFDAMGGTTGAGINAQGGGTSGAGINAVAAGINEIGIRATGRDAGAGILATGGSDGHGIEALGGSTTGDGIHAEAQTLGDGIEAVGAGGGFDINADIQGSLSGNVGGNVVGSVGSIAAGGITASSFAANSITAAALAADAGLEIISQVIGVADSGSTTTLVDAARTEADADYWVGSILLITSGSTVGQMRLITDFDPGTDTITVDPAFTQAISTNDYAILRTAIGTSASGGGPTAPQIADAVWDELRAGHVVAGSFGEGVASVQGNVTGSVGSVAAGGINAASIATGAIDADALATDAVNEIVDQVWDEALADHVAAGSMGFNENLIDDILADTDVIQPLVSTNLDATVSSRATPAQVNTEVDTALADIRLDELIQNAAAPADPTADSFIDLITSKDAGQTFDRSTDSLEALADSGGGGPTAGQIADAVWDEALAGHLTVGSTGEALDAAASGGAGLTPQQVADALKLAPAAGAPAAGSVYAEFDVLMGPGFNPATDSLEEIRDEVDACCGSGGGGEVINIEGI